jgi:hypothetical protein
LGSPFSFDNIIADALYPDFNAGAKIRGLAHRDRQARNRPDTRGLGGFRSRSWRPLLTLVAPLSEGSAIQR